MPRVSHFAGNAADIYTDLGLASTPDGGKTWVYRGVMQGLGAPDAWQFSGATEEVFKGMRQNGTAHGGATWWRPAVIYNPDDDRYHGFFACELHLLFCLNKFC